jgi:hypothetical protein
MRVQDAKAIARQWVIEKAQMIPGFYAAYYAGSTTWLAEDALLPPTSDVDIIVVVDNPNPREKLGKFIYHNVLLEVTYLPKDQLPSPDVVLGDYHLAGSFRRPSIILDPSGQLTKLQRAVSPKYAKRHWVTQRCEQAHQKIIERVQGLNPSTPLHDQITTWLFAVGGMPHVLLVAALHNPTVRRRYLAAKELLEGYGHEDFYETLLDCLGCAQMNRQQVEDHLAALTEVFDAAKEVIKTPVFFAADISENARVVAIDGSRDLIEQGNHREAIFWMVATYSRCQMVLYQDAPLAIQEQFTPAYHHLLADLGITSPALLPQRGEQIKTFLPQLWEMTETILTTNPGIEE